MKTRYKILIPFVTMIIVISIFSVIWVMMYVQPSSSYNDPTVDDFRKFLSKSSDIDTIFDRFGEPHSDIGSGIHIYVYKLNDSTEIWIGYAGQILYVQHVDSNGTKLEQLL